MINKLIAIFFLLVWFLIFMAICGFGQINPFLKAAQEAKEKYLWNVVGEEYRKEIESYVDSYLEKIGYTDLLATVNINANFGKPLTGYCVGCKMKVPIVNPRVKKSYRGIWARVGNCVYCGTGTWSILSIESMKDYKRALEKYNPYWKEMAYEKAGEVKRLERELSQQRNHFFKFWFIKL